MYDVYLDKILLPVTPSKIQLKIKNQNKTVTLINEGEINLLKKAGLTEISFTAMIPQLEYKFAKYPGDFQRASFFLDAFEKMKTEPDQNPFQFIVSRALPDGTLLFDSDIKVSMEDYVINEDAKNGFDLMVDIRLKQFRPYKTKMLQLDESENVQGAPTATFQQDRPAETAPQAKAHTIASGDTLWAIAKKYYGNGNDYTKIYEANKDKISNPNTIYPGTEITIP